MIELLPCPFCGSAAKFGEVWESIHDAGPRAYSVYCSYCYVGTSTEQTKEEVADIWNQRVPQNSNEG